MKQLFSILAFLMALNLVAQTNTTIYFFPGQGSDKRIFDSLEIDPKYKVKYIEYGTPSDRITMSTFARQLSRQIDTTEEFMLIGVSLGGMICVELAELLNPKKTIIISSAKNRNELPCRYKFQRKIPLYKLFSGNYLLAGAKILQPIVEPAREKKRTLKSMLRRKDATYMERTVGLNIKWDRQLNSKMIYSIHGTNDHTIPLKNIQSPTNVGSISSRIYLRA